MIELIQTIMLIILAERVILERNRYRLCARIYWPKTDMFGRGRGSFYINLLRQTQINGPYLNYRTLFSFRFGKKLPVHRSAPRERAQKSEQVL